MPIAAGTRVGAYEVLAPLGAGAMGEVYRARDTRLQRDVALKVLPPEGASDAALSGTSGSARSDRDARFMREARAASALNHPHIVSVHDSGEAGGIRYIAMELVDGAPLTEWVARTGAELARVLDVFLQLANALAAAHQAGIVHRDLKPANVLVTPQGYVKVVDFGLAKIGGVFEGPAAATLSETATRADVGGPGTGTAAGLVLGTVSYMSPEQALGRPADARSDIFSVGVMLFEALAKKRPFDHPSVLDTLHAVVHDPAPPLPARDKAWPAELEWALHKCLAKDPDERYQSVGELAADLRRIRRQSAAGHPAGPPSADSALAPGAAPSGKARTRRLWPLAAGLLLGGAASGLAIAWVMRPPAKAVAAAPLVSAVKRLTWDTGYEGEPSWAPDGRSLVYTSDRDGNFDIYLRQVSGGPAVNLTNDPSDEVQPAFSPDGKQIAFVSSRKGPPLRYSTAESPRFGGSIFVMSALGGAARFVAEGNFPAWSADGREIVFVAGGWFERRLFRVAATGGTPQAITVKMDSAFEARAAPGIPQDLLSPAWSPDGGFLAFEALGTIYVVRAGGDRGVAVAEGRGPAWVRSPLGLVYTASGRASGDSLWRVPLSPVDGRPTGPPEPVTVGRGHDAQAAVSPDGRSIAFAAMETTSNVERIAFDLDRALPSSAPVSVTSGNDPIYFFHSSPDGRAIVYSSPQTGGLWLAAEGKRPVELSLDPTQADAYPRWSPDGRRIVFTRRPRSAGRVPGGLWLMDPDGGNPLALGLAAFNSFVNWTADSRGLVFEQAADRQIHVIDLTSKADRALTREKGVMPVAALTRDGDWLAYQSTDSPARNVVLRALRMSTGGPSQLVVDTGDNAYHPFFSPSGRWLYFTPDHQAILRVPGPAQQWRRAAPEQVATFRDATAFIEDPQPSGDGRAILYARRRLSADLWLLTLER